MLNKRVSRKSIPAPKSIAGPVVRLEMFEMPGPTVETLAPKGGEGGAIAIKNNASKPVRMVVLCRRNRTIATFFR
jgi:hypothetical protein